MVVDIHKTRRVRLNANRGSLDDYARKEVFMEMCIERGISLCTIDEDPDASGNWTDSLNTRRCDLIDKRFLHELTPDEAAELAQLQERANAHFDIIAAPPIEGATKLLQKLIADREEQSPS